MGTCPRGYAGGAGITEYHDMVMNKMNNINEEQSRNYRAIGTSTLLPLGCVPFGCAAYDTAQLRCLRRCVELYPNHTGPICEVDNIAQLLWISHIVLLAIFQR